MSISEFLLYSFFSVLRFINLDNLDDESQFKTEGFKIALVNSPEELHPLIQHPTTYESLGSIQLNNFIKNPIAYVFLNDNLGLGKFELLNRIHNLIFLKAHYLWFVKDCSCNIEFTLNVDLQDGKCRINRSHHRFTKANGLLEITTFSNTEWELAEEYQKKFNAIDEDLPFDKEAHAQTFSRYYSSATANFTNHSKTNRIQRAMDSLALARVSSVIATKISIHVQILETLFAAGENGELTYKLSQRVAAYLERDLTKRKILFDEIKGYYDFRSRYLHGQPLDGKYDNRDTLVKYSERIDEIMRIILTKVLDNPAPFLVEKSKDLRAFFDDLMYS